MENGERKRFDPELWICPNLKCWKGTLEDVCDACAGEGVVDGVACVKCDGSAVVKTGVCDVCGGSGHVTRALGKLYEADDHIKSSEPGWDCHDESGKDATVYSLAAWYRLRVSFGTPALIFAERKANDYRVTFVSWPGAIHVFNGLAWGYGGEGPMGFATILADAFPKAYRGVEDARGSLIERDGDRSFVMTIDKDVVVVLPTGRRDPRHADTRST